MKRSKGGWEKFQREQFLYKGSGQMRSFVWSLISCIVLLLCLKSTFCFVGILIATRQSLVIWAVMAVYAFFVAFANEFFERRKWRWLSQLLAFLTILVGLGVTTWLQWERMVSGAADFVCVYRRAFEKYYFNPSLSLGRIRRPCNETDVFVNLMAIAVMVLLQMIALHRQRREYLLLLPITAMGVHLLVGIGPDEMGLLALLLALVLSTVPSLVYRENYKQTACLLLGMVFVLFPTIWLTRSAAEEVADLFEKVYPFQQELEEKLVAKIEGVGGIGYEKSSETVGEEVKEDEDAIFYITSNKSLTRNLYLKENSYSEYQDGEWISDGAEKAIDCGMQMLDEVYMDQQMLDEFYMDQRASYCDCVYQQGYHLLGAYGTINPCIEMTQVMIDYPEGDKTRTYYPYFASYTYGSPGFYVDGDGVPKLYDGKKDSIEEAYLLLGFRYHDSMEVYDKLWEGGFVLVDPNSYEYMVSVTYAQAVREIYTVVPHYASQEFDLFDIYIKNYNKREQGDDRLDNFYRLNTLKQIDLNASTWADPESEIYLPSLMYILRYKGIPTRYCKGYLIKAENKKKARFAVTEEMLDDWLEVYFDRIGWVPIDFDPSTKTEDQFVDLECLVRIEASQKRMEDANPEEDCNAEEGIEPDATETVEPSESTEMESTETESTETESTESAEIENTEPEGMETESAIDTETAEATEGAESENPGETISGDDSDGGDSSIPGPPTFGNKPGEKSEEDPDFPVAGPFLLWLGDDLFKRIRKRKVSWHKKKMQDLSYQARIEWMNKSVYKWMHFRGLEFWRIKSDEDYCNALKKRYPEVEWDNFMNVVRKEVYSNEEVTKEDVEIMSKEFEAFVEGLKAKGTEFLHK